MEPERHNSICFAALSPPPVRFNPASPSTPASMSKSFDDLEGPLSSSPSIGPALMSSPSTISDNINNNIKEKTYEGVTFETPLNVDDSIISSAASEYEFDDDGEEKDKIPDGGWGWVVVLASLVISMVADGISFSFGLLYIEFLKHFGASKSTTAWIGSLFMAVPLLSGPICSSLVDRYGCRWMTILGGIISGIGFILSSFSETILTMYLTFGVLAGLGLGLCYVTAVVSIAYWFDKKRTLATSLGACGTGIGTFVYAPLTSYFIREYGWRGTTLLLAGTFFNMCVCGAVMRDPEWWTRAQSKSQSLANKSIRGASSCGSISGRSAANESDFPGVEEIRRLLKSGQTPEYILSELVTSMGKSPTAATVPEEGLPDLVDPNFHSVVNLPTFIRQSEKVPLEVLESLSSNTRMFNVILENYPSLLLCRSISDNAMLHSDAVQMRVPITMSMRVKPTTKVENETAPFVGALVALDSSAVPLLAPDLHQPQGKHPHHKHMATVPPTRVDSVPWLRRQFSMKENTNHYLSRIKVHRNSVMYRGALLNIHKYRLRASSCPDIYRNSMTTIAKESHQSWRGELLELFRGMADFSMFLEWHFLLMSLATVLLFTWFIVPYFYLAEHVTRHGMTEGDASKILSVIGITNTIGMIFLGWAGDQRWMNVTKVYAVCLVLCGFSTLGMPLFTDNYWALVATCASFGVFFASNFSFTPTILVELIPLERFTTAYGLTLLCQGIGNLLGPPLAGWVFDVTGSWDLTFYLAGVWIIVAGVLVALIPATDNRRVWGDAPIEKGRDSLA